MITVTNGEIKIKFIFLIGLRIFYIKFEAFRIIRNAVFLWIGVTFLMSCMSFD